MYRRLLPTLALTLCLATGLSAPLWAQSPPEGEDEADSGDQREDSSSESQKRADRVEDTSEKVEASGGDDLPDAPGERLELAEEAFDNADYEMLAPLLEPTLVPESRFGDRERERRARTLLGVGLYFAAQQVTDADERRELLEGVEEQFLALLRADPDHELSPLIFPASVVEFFDSVKEEHDDELAAIRAERGDDGHDQPTQGLSTVYLERQVDHQHYAVNFFPLGLGQFQNGEPLQGAAFAAGQVGGLALNVASYWVVESLRGPDGYYEPGAGNSADVARQWRVAQFAGLGLFAAVYAWSVADSLLDYSGSEVRIRTLDEPPPELGGRDEDDNGASFQIGLEGINIAW